MLQQAIEKNNGISKHIQLKQIAMKMISSNHEAGSRFLSERELMKQFKVSSTTVSKAMKALVNENILERRVGGGTFVKDTSNIKLPPDEYNHHPTLMFSKPYKQSIRKMTSVNWFIYNDIQNSIINNYPGKTFAEDTSEILKAAEAGKIIWAILINPTEEEIERICKTSANYTVIAQNHNIPPCANSIRWECVTGIYQLMTHFVELGHEKIAMITGKHESHHHRIEGFKFSLNSFGLQLPDEYFIQEPHGDVDDGYSAMQKLLALPDPPTAVFVDTDIKAEGAIKAVRDSGLNVPDDISIAGFDDIPDAAHFTPAITTIRAPYPELGIEAVKLLNKVVQSKQPVMGKVLPTELIIRETTGSKKSSMVAAVVEAQHENCYT
jgi:DNA-binding LacI/PurR family transcriptional regulator/DNA-binding transcriptional regulator YhcF (GntR family)